MVLEALKIFGIVILMVAGVLGAIVFTALLFAVIATCIREFGRKKR